MRRLVSIVALLVGICFLTACSNTQDEISVADKYKTIVQEYLDKGDVETAKKALEEGIGLTNDDSLKAMLEDVVLKEKKVEEESVETEKVAPEASESQTITDNNTQQNTSVAPAVEGLYYPVEGSEGIVVITDYSNSSIEFAICAIGTEQSAGVMGKKEIQNGVCNFEYKDTQGNTGKGKITLGNNKLSLELSTTQWFGNYGIDAAKGEYEREEDVPIDLIIYEYCDGGIIY